MSGQVKIEKIFTEEDVDNFSMSSNPILLVYETYYNYLFRTTGKVVLDSNMIMAISEFHVSNLIFLKEKFTFPVVINCKILNILALLLNLREEERLTQEDLENSKLRKHSSIANSKEEAPQVIDNKEIDFSMICNQKLHQVKLAFFQEKLLKTEMKYEKLADRSNDFEKPYYLKPIEIANIMDYLNLFYFSNIKLYYHFINIEKITNNKRIDVVINKPLPIPPLHFALLQPPDKNEIMEMDEEDDNKPAENVSFPY